MRKENAMMQNIPDSITQLFLQFHSKRGVEPHELVVEHKTPVLAPWHICSQNPGFSQNGCAKEPAQGANRIIHHVQ